LNLSHSLAIRDRYTSIPFLALQVMANDFDPNMGNNIRMRDTQFISMFLAENLGKSGEMYSPMYSPGTYRRHQLVF
jgi:hypothetical protein